MQSKKLMKCAIACIPCFFVASNLHAQTQRQQNNPLDQLQPTDTKASYDVPAMSASKESANNDRQFPVTSISLKKIVPNAAKTGVASLEAVDDAQLNSMIKQLLTDTQNTPTYQQIIELSAQLSLVLRQRGDILSTVFVPAQKVEQGALELHLLQGTLGKVDVTGNKTKSDDIIANAFDAFTGKVVTRNEVESQLLRIQNLLPGVTASGAFRRGAGLGESDAVINVGEIDSFHGSVYIDNYGNAATGEVRLGSRFVFNNPFGWEDRLRFDLLANETPDGFDDPNNPIKKDDYECCFGGVSYEIFNDALTYSYGIEWFHTQYDIGNNADFQLARLGFSGESESTRLFANYFRTLTSTFTDTITVAWSYTESELSALNNALGRDVLLNRDQVAEWNLGYSFTLRDGVDVYYGQLNAFIESESDHLFPLPDSWVGRSDDTVNELGFAVTPSRLGADDGSSNRLHADLHAQVASLTDNVKFKGHLAFQMTSDILAPVQQLSLAGPYAVRAYPSGSFLADTGVLASLDVIVPLMPSLELSAFYDVANGEIKSANDAADTDATIQGAGIGLKYSYQNQLTVQLTAARGIRVDGGNIRTGGDDVTGRDNTQLFASILYNF